MLNKKDVSVDNNDDYKLIYLEDEFNKDNQLVDEHDEDEETNDLIKVFDSTFNNSLQ